MGWLTKVIALAALQYISPTCGSAHPFPSASINGNYLESTGTLSEDNPDSIIVDPELPVDDEKLQAIGNYLTGLLLLPWNGRGLPLLYIEDEPQTSFDFEETEGYDQYDKDIAQSPPFKRSRYYRKYPWKRQNSRQTYDAENRYLCQPSKDDVFRLLVALHEARQGNKGRTINFCNRKRPAAAIFTNMRFLG